MVTYDHHHHQEEEEDDSSSEEAEINHNDSSGAIRRSYECIYCKRGFNTAQALGGHMNIHRKDRANKNKKPSSTSNKKPKIYHQANPNLCLNVTNLQSYNDHSLSLNNQDHHLQLGLMNLPRSLINTSSDEHHTKVSDYKYHHQRSSNGSMEACDWMMRLSSKYSPVIGEDLEMNKQVIIDYDEDLDLELRLGYI